MEQFLIEIPHEEQNCLDLIRLLRSRGDLTNFECGCQNGVHTGWAVISADNEEVACLVVPSVMRREARVITVAKFDPTTIARVEKNEAAFPSPALLRMYNTFPCWW